MSLSGLGQAARPLAGSAWRAARPALGNVLRTGVYGGAAVLGLPFLGSALRGSVQSAFPGSLDPSGGTPGGTTQPPATEPPSQGTFEDQIKILTDLIRAQNEQSTALSQAELEQRGQYLEAITDPTLYAQRAAVDQANYERMQELGRIAGMEQTRELTRRKIEGDTISAWRGITEAQIDANAKLGLGMMNLAYTAGMPNPNVLQGGASLAGQGRSSFGTPSSTIS